MYVCVSLYVFKMWTNEWASVRNLRAILFVEKENPSLFVHVWARAYSSGYIEIVSILFFFSFAILDAFFSALFYYHLLHWFRTISSQTMFPFIPNWDLLSIWNSSSFLCVSACINETPSKICLEGFVFMPIWTIYNIVSRFELLIVVLFCVLILFSQRLQQKQFFVHIRTLMTLLIIKATTKFERMPFFISHSVVEWKSMRLNEINASEVNLLLLQ